MAKFRHEFKHIINPSDYYAVKSRLSSVLMHDKFAKEDGTYKISSLYFDNVYDKALREKIDGVNDREKFRIRLYNDDTSFIKLEKKSKKNGLCQKIAERVTAEEVRRIINGDIEWMKGSKKGLICELYAKMRYQQLRPTVIVSYTREAFVYPPGNVRVTLDYDIRTALKATDILNPERVEILTGTNIVMEIKYDEYFPSIIRDLVQVPDRRASAFSKYAKCRIYD
ncbi:MAG: polyphosphate polymerase domain-containing protein [Clostridia bacterium]|nr:polyphosphate polymerase domain-containing protein [Clostridia bacterium]